MATESLTEGCFVLRTPAASADSREPSVAWGFRPLLDGQETIGAQRERYDAFRATWEHTSAVCREEEAKLNVRVRDDLYNFLCEAIPPRRPDMPFLGLRTALISAGGTNQEQFLADLSSKVNSFSSDGRRMRAAVVDARNCPDVRQFVLRVVRALTVTDDDDGAATQTLPGLAAWYREQAPGLGLALLVREFESLEPSVFGSFVSAVSECYADIPLSLALGISSSPDILWRTMHGQAHAQLAKRQFALEHPSVALDAIVRRLFISPACGVRLGVRPYGMMVESFLQVDQSLRSVWHAIEYSTMEHYYANPLSLLCPPPTTTAAQFHSWAADIADRLDSHQLLALQRLPSFRKLCETLAEAGNEADTARVRRLLQKEDAVRDEVTGFLTELWRAHSRFAVGLAVLQAAEVAVMRGASSERLLYFSGLQQRLADQPGVRRVVDLFPRTSGEFLVKLADQLLTLVSPLTEDVNAGDADREAVETISSAARALLEHQEAFEAEADADADMIDGGTNVLDLWAQNELAAARQTSRSRRSGDVLPPTAGLAQGARLHIRRTKQLAALVESLQSALGSLFNLCLVHYTEIPLHELWYFTKSTTLRKALHPQPRASVQTALSNPRHYLNYDAIEAAAEAADKEAATEPPSSPSKRGREDQGVPAQGADPDVCVLYNLYSESGRLINLYDLFVAFASVVDSRPTRDLEASADLRARFLRGLAELHLLGLIKPTRRKTDHVMRLTWSSGSIE